MPVRRAARQWQALPAIVFIHGLWLLGESWNNSVQFFRENGYEAIAANWPGDSETTETIRKSADAVAGYGLTEIADHIAEQLKAFGKKPIRSPSSLRSFEGGRKQRAGADDPDQRRKSR